MKVFGLALALAGTAVRAQEEQERTSFSQWVAAGGLTSRRALQSEPSCMSDCTFPANSPPASCTDLQALFEGTFDSQLGLQGCGLDCTAADDVAAIQTLFRGLEVGYRCVNVETGAFSADLTTESTCGNTCAGTYSDGASTGLSCATAFADAANEMGSSCPAECTFTRHEWRKDQFSFGREGDADPGCMLPFSFVSADTTEKSTCPIGYDKQSDGSCTWDNSYCAVHTISGDANAGFTHSYALPTGKECKSCWNGYTSDGKYVCPCSLACVL